MTRDELITAYQNAKRDEKLKNDQKVNAERAASEAGGRYLKAQSVTEAARAAMLAGIDRER